MKRVSRIFGRRLPLAAIVAVVAVGISVPVIAQGEGQSGTAQTAKKGKNKKPSVKLVRGPRGKPGTNGLNGKDGVNGKDGAAGPTGPAGATNVTTRLKTQSLPVGENDLTAACLAGEKAVGGGGNIPPEDPEVTIVASNPSPATDSTTPTGWTMRFRITGIPHAVTTSVVCVR